MSDRINNDETVRERLALRYAASGVRFLVNALDCHRLGNETDRLGARSTAFEDLLAAVSITAEPSDGKVRVAASREDTPHHDLDSSIRILREYVKRLEQLREE